MSSFLRNKSQYLILLFFFGMLNAGIPDWMKPYFEYASDSKESVILYVSTDIRFEKDNRKVTTFRKMVYLGNKHDIASELPESFYFNDNIELKNIRIYYKLPGEKVKKVKNKVLTRTEGVGYSLLYSDDRYLTWAPGFLPPGTLIGIEYTSINTSPRHASWVSVQGIFPIKEYHLDIHYPFDGVSILQFFNDHLQTGLPQKFTPDSAGNFTVTLTDISKLNNYELIRLPVNDRPIFYYRLGMKPGINHPNLAYETWEDLGAAYYRYYYNIKPTPHPGIDSTVAALTDGLDSELEKIQAVTRWVQEKIRYIAVEIGEGRQRPYPASQTFLNKYGDCKDKSHLLNDLLSRIPIESRPVLLHTRGNWRVDKQFPMNQFNHVISAIRVKDEDLISQFRATEIANKKYILFDPTNPVVPFGELPEYDEGIYMLFLDEDRGHLFESPSRSYKENRWILNTSYFLGNAGELTCDFTFRFSGQFAFDLIRTLNSEGDPGQIVEDMILPFFPGSTIGSYELDEMENPQDITTLKISFTCPPAKKYNKSFIPYKIRQYGYDTGTFEEKKESHYYFESPFQVIDTTTVHLDVEYEMDELPEDIHFINDVGEYHTKFIYGDHRCQMISTFSVFQRFVEKKNYSQLRALFDVRNAGEKSILLLTK